MGILSSNVLTAHPSVCECMHSKLNERTWYALRLSTLASAAKAVMAVVPGQCGKAMHQDPACLASASVQSFWQTL